MKITVLTFLAKKGSFKVSGLYLSDLSFVFVFVLLTIGIALLSASEFR